MINRVPSPSTITACMCCRWIAPEVLAGSHYDRAADVYAFGVILWEILTWQVPWDDLGPWQVSAIPSQLLQWLLMLVAHLQYLSCCTTLVAFAIYVTIQQYMSPFTASRPITPKAASSAATDKALSNPSSNRQWSSTALLGVLLCFLDSNSMHSHTCRAASCLHCSLPTV